MKSIKFVLFSRPLFTSNVSVILFVLWSINSVPLFFVPAACLILYFVKPFYNSIFTKILLISIPITSVPKLPDIRSQPSSYGTFPHPTRIVSSTLAIALCAKYKSVFLPLSMTRCAW